MPKTSTTVEQVNTHTTVPSTIVLGDNPGIFPLSRRIFLLDRCINLELCICTIPVLGFYEKHGEVTSTTIGAKFISFWSWHYHHFSTSQGRTAVISGHSSRTSFPCQRVSAACRQPPQPPLSSFVVAIVIIVVVIPVSGRGVPCARWAHGPLALCAVG